MAVSPKQWMAVSCEPFSEELPSYGSFLKRHLVGNEDDCHQTRWEVGYQRERARSNVTFCSTIEDASKHRMDPSWLTFCWSLHQLLQFYPLSHGKTSCSMVRNLLPHHTCQLDPSHMRHKKVLYYSCLEKVRVWWWTLALHSSCNIVCSW